MENPLQDFTSAEEPKESQDHTLQIRTTRKVLHFSDGVIEEFSDDEDVKAVEQIDVVDPKTLDWGPWLMHYAWSSSNKALEYCDYMGEGLANFLGITTPKYQLEISEHERLEAQKQKEAADSAGWMTSTGANGATPLVISQPSLISQDVAPSPV